MYYLPVNLIMAFIKLIKLKTQTHSKFLSSILIPPPVDFFKVIRFRFTYSPSYTTAKGTPTT